MHHQFRALYALRKPGIILDVSRYRELSAGLRPVDDERQKLRPRRVDRRRKTCRAGAENDDFSLDISCGHLSFDALQKLEKFEKDFGKDPKRLKSASDYYLSGYKTDQQIRDENVASAKKLKEQEIKKFRAELEKTTSGGLLDSPAVVRVMYYSDPIFDNDPKTGSMVVTENPDYIRKDLPGHVPQFMVFTWKWSPEFWPVHKGYEKKFLQDFPIEKIQAMIDK